MFVLIKYLMFLMVCSDGYNLHTVDYTWLQTVLKLLIYL